MNSCELNGAILRKVLNLFLSTIISVSFIALPPTAASAVFGKKFDNCQALNKVYPGGVAKSSKWVNKGGNLTKTPTVNSKVYAANIGKDRDKDGLACEN